MYAEFSHDKYVAHESDGYARMQITITGNEHRKFSASLYMKTFVSSKLQARPGKHNDLRMHGCINLQCMCLDDWSLVSVITMLVNIVASSDDVHTGRYLVILNAGVNTKTIRIGITDDKLVEGTEAFGAQLFVPDHHKSKCLKLGNTSVTTVYIHDGMS